MATRPSRRTAGIVMWGVIALAAVVLVTLLAAGWEGGAWAAAAAVLFVGCVAVCIWAGVQGRTTEREVNRLIARLAKDRAARDRARFGVQHEPPGATSTDDTNGP